jgi:hypothetical protein
MPTGPDQVRRLRRGAVNTMLLMVAIVAGFAAIIIFIAERPIAPWRWGLIVVVALAGLAVGVHRSAQLRHALRDGRVECLAGPVRVTMRGRAGWWLTVADQSFHLPVRFWHVGPELIYRVYVAPAAQLILAMEPQPDVAALVVSPIAFAHTGDAERPFTATVAGVTLLVQVNDFPAEPLYSVLADGVSLGDLDDWPTAWTRPATPEHLHALATQSPRGAALVAVTAPLDAAALHTWATTLCTTTAADTETVLRALRFDGPLVDSIGSRRLESPPAQTTQTDVSESGGELFTVRFTPGPVPVTRGALDAELGEGREVVRIHWDAVHRVLYPITADGAPFTCDVIASFRDQPVADAIAFEIILRRQR